MASYLPSKAVSQLKGLLAVLPVDITFIDENDVNRFFTNEGKVVIITGAGSDIGEQTARSLVFLQFPSLSRPAKACTRLTTQETAMAGKTDAGKRA